MTTNVRLLSLLSLVAVAGCTNGPPSRSSPALLPTDEPLPHGFLVDTRDDTPFWARYEGERLVLENAERTIDAPPGHERDVPRGLREIDGTVWTCFDEDVARWEDGTWTIFTGAAIAGIPEDQTPYCSGIDGRAADDVWVALGTLHSFDGDLARPLCHFDGAAWDCHAATDVSELLVTPEHVWWIETQFPDDVLRVLDPTRPDDGSIEISLGALRRGVDLVAIPGREEIVVHHWAGSDGDAMPLVIGADGHTRPVGIEGRVLPREDGVMFVVTTEEEGDSDCRGLLDCTYTLRWAQAVVYRIDASGTHELAHRTIEMGPGFSAWLLDQDGTVYVAADGWFTIP